MASLPFKLILLTDQPPNLPDRGLDTPPLSKSTLDLVKRNFLSLKRSEREPSGGSGGVGLVRSGAPNPEVVEKPVRRQFSAPHKLGVVREADGCREPGKIGALLRREGLCSSHLAAWRRQREAGLLASLAPRKRGRKAKERNPLQRRLAQLERENARLARRLQQAELKIVSSVSDGTTYRS